MCFITESLLCDDDKEMAVEVSREVKFSVKSCLLIIYSVKCNVVLCFLLHFDEVIDLFCFARYGVQCTYLVVQAVWMVRA